MSIIKPLCALQVGHIAAWSLFLPLQANKISVSVPNKMWKLKLCNTTKVKCTSIKKQKKCEWQTISQAKALCPVSPPKLQLYPSYAIFLLEQLQRCTNTSSIHSFDPLLIFMKVLMFLSLCRTCIIALGPFFREAFPVIEDHFLFYQAMGQFLNPLEKSFLNLNPTLKRFELKGNPRHGLQPMWGTREGYM